MSNDAKHEIDRLVATFFSLFSNRDGALPDLARLFDLCVPQAILTKCAGAEPELMSLEAFMRPRQELLSSGSLVDFQERETSERTLVFGGLAQRASTYVKSGCLNGVWFETHGLKVFQFVRCQTGWRIVSLAWDDERADLSLTQTADFGALRLPPRPNAKNQ